MQKQFINGIKDMNQLEAVVLVTTAAEIDNGLFEKFINRISRSDPCDLSFIVIINAVTHQTDILPIVDRLYHVFKSVEIVYANIPPSEDIYIRDINHKPVPELGLVSGPNLLFFSAMNYCQTFNTVLLLETDCYVRPDFVERLTLFTKHSGGFLIAGTMYDDIVRQDTKNHTFFHLNGVALYKTSDPDFHTLLNLCYTFITKHVKQYPFVAYDVALTHLVLQGIESDENPAFYASLFKRMIRTGYFVNLSPPQQMHRTDMLKSYPNAVIIHKKPTDTDAQALPGFLV